MAKGEPDFTINILDQLGVKIPKDRRAEALDAAADLIKEAILLRTSQAKTSVEGGLWKATLEEPYRTEKRKEVGTTKPNMEFSGQMLDALDVRREGDKIRIVVDGDQADKAEGNLLGSYGRSPDEAKAREFMPHKRGQRLHSSIMEDLRTLLEGFTDGEED